MKQYTVADSLGREITFDWEDDAIAPTDSDFEEIFKQADSFKPQVTPEPEQYKLPFVSELPERYKMPATTEEEITASEQSGKTFEQPTVELSKRISKGDMSRTSGGYGVLEVPRQPQKNVLDFGETEQRVTLPQQISKEGMSTTTEEPLKITPMPEDEASKFIRKQTQPYIPGVPSSVPTFGDESPEGESVLRLYAGGDIKRAGKKLQENIGPIQENIERGKVLAESIGLTPEKIKGYGTVPSELSKLLPKGWSDEDKNSTYAYGISVLQEKQKEIGRSQEEYGKKQIKKALEINPVWLQVDRIRNDVAKLEKTDPGVVQSWKKGELGVGIDQKLFNIAMSGDKTAYKQIAAAKEDYENTYKKLSDNEDKKGWVEKNVRSIAEMLPPMIKGGILSAIPGIGPILGQSYWATQGGGDIIYQATQKGIPLEDALKYGIGGGLVYAAIEGSQVGKLSTINPFLKGILQKKIASFIISRPLEALDESIEEGIQSIVTDLSVMNAMKDAGMDVNQKEEFKEALKNGFNAFKESLVPMAALGIGGTIKGAVALKQDKKETDIGLPKAQKPTEAKTDIGIPQGTKTLAELKIPTPEAYYKLPEGRRDEVFGQLSPEEQDRVMAVYPEELLEPKTETPVQVPEVQETAEQLSDAEAREILRKAKGVPEIDLSKVTPEQQAEIADREKYRQKRALKTAQTEPSPYQFQQPNDEDKATGERVAKKYGLVFKEAIPGDRDKGGVRLVFSDPVTENEISLSPETADTEAAKIADKIRQEKPEEYGKKMASAAGVEFIGRKAQITEATAAGKYNTIAVGNYRTKLGNNFTVPFSASVDEIRAMAEETDKQGAKNVPEVQQRQEKAEIEPSAVIRPNRDYDRMLAAYVKTGKPETSPGRSAHEGLVGVIDQVAPEDIADAVGLSPAEARQAIGDIREQRKSEVSQKVRQAFAPELFYGRPVEEIVEGIRQPRAASGEVIFQREEQFIRAATKKEKYSSSAKNDGYNSIPDKDGFEKVYKPYGEQGAGYYYSRKIEPTQQEAFGGETPVSEIERKAEQRQQKAAVAERQEARKGGEAPLTGLPMFEDQDIEGSQMTLKLQRENKEKVAGLKRRLKDIEWRELDELREAVRVGTLSREDFNKKWENAGKRADAIRRKLYDLTGDAYGESKEYKQRKKVVREKKEKERKSVLDQIAVTSEEYDTEVVDYPARGFLLPDGNYLSIGSGTDHRSINGMVEYPNEDQTDTGYRTKKMERIMADSGAIRFIPESGVFDIKSDPTQEQIDEIRKYAEQNGSVEVEFKNGSSKSYTSDDIYDLSDDIERGGVRFQREERPMDLDTAKEIATSNGLQYVTSTPAEGGPRYTFREPRTGTEFTAKTRGEVRQAIGDLADRVAPRGTTKAGTGVRFQREDEKRTSEQESQLKRLRAEKEARYQQEALPEEVAQWEANNKLIDFFRNNGYTIEETPQGARYVKSSPEVAERYWTAFDRDTDPGIETYEGAEAFGKSRQAPRTEPGVRFSREDELIFDAGTAEDEARGKAIADQLGNVKFNGVWKGFRSKDGTLHRDPQLTFTIYDNKGKGGTSILAPLDSTPGQVAKRRAEVLKGEVRFQIEEQTFQGEDKPQIRSQSFKNWFGDWENNPENASKVVDENGKPLIVYSGHANAALYGDEYKPKLGTAGGFYASEDPQIASGYAMGKLGVKEYYERGSQYRFKQKNRKYGKKLWQVELTLEQIKKLESIVNEKNEYDEYKWDFNEMDLWVNNHAGYEKEATRMKATGSWHNPRYALQNIFDFYEWMGYNISYDKTGSQGERLPVHEAQQTNRFEDLLNELGIEWQSYEFAQPGVMSVYLNIRNPLDADKPFPKGLLLALKSSASRERKQGTLDDKWTKEYPLKEWVKEIEENYEYWTTEIPQKALQIIKKFGYDGIKERGQKGSEKPREERQINWIAFEPEQIKSATGNTGAFNPQEKSMLFQKEGQRGPQDIRREPTEEVPEARRRNLPPEEAPTSDARTPIMRAFRDFQRAVGTAIGERLPEDGITISDTPQTEAHQVADRLVSEEFGGTPIWFSVSPEARDLGVNFGGAQLTNHPDVVLMNTETKAPVIITAVHETMHRMQQQRPDLYWEVRDAMVEESTPEFEGFRQKMLDKGYSEREVMDEMVAEISGQRFVDQGFLKRLAERSPEAFREFVDTLRRVIEDIRAWIKGANITHAGKYFRDLDRVDTVLADAMVEFRRSEQGRRQPQWMAAQRETRFSRDQTKTEAFRNWFKGSKVVDENGEPLVVYKGMPVDDYKTGQRINVINRESEFPAFNSGEKGTKIAGFFSSNPKVASRFAMTYSKGGKGNAVFPTYLSFKKPFTIDAKGEFAGNIEFGSSGQQFRDAIRSGKYDGIIIKNTKDEGDVYVALSPTQIKSATGNRGTFDPENPDIRFSRETKDQIDRKTGVAEPEIMTNEYRATELRKEATKLRRKLGKAPQAVVDSRADLELRIRDMDDLSKETVQAAIISYADFIGLTGEPRNQVVAIVRRSKTPADLRRAVESMDRIMERRQHSALVKRATEAVAETFVAIKKAQGKTRSTVDAEANRQMQEYVKNLMPDTWSVVDENGKTIETFGSLEDAEELVKTSEDYRVVSDNERADKMVSYWLGAGKEVKTDIDRYASDLGKDVLNWIDKGGAIPANAQKIVNTIIKSGITDRSNADLLRIIRDLRSIRKFGRTAYMAQEAQRKTRETAEAQQAASEIKLNRPIKSKERQAAEATTPAAKKQYDKEQSKWKKYGYGLLSAETIMEKMSGWKSNPKLKQLLFDPFYRAASSEARQKKAIVDFFKKTYGNDVWKMRIEPMVDLIYEEKFPGEEPRRTTQTLTVEQAMGIYALSKDPGQRRRLAMTIAPENLEFAEAQIDQVSQALPKQYRDMVEKQWDYYYENQYNRINPVYRKEHNIDMPRIRYYMPLGGLNSDPSAHIAEDVMERQSGRASTQKGMTISRTATRMPLANYRYFDMVLGNMQKVEHYIAFNEAVRQANRYMANKDLLEVMDAHSPVAREQIENWINAMARGTSQVKDQDSIDSVINWMRNVYSVFQLGGKLTSMAMQVSALPRGLAFVKPKYAMKALGIIARYPKKTYDMIDDLSPIMEERIRNWDMAVTEFAENEQNRKIFNEKTLGDSWRQIRDFTMYGIGYLDKKVAGAVWLGKYMETLDKEISGGEQQAMEKAVAAADEIVRKTQQGGGLLNSSKLERGSAMSRAITQFMSENRKTLQMAYEYASKFKGMSNKDRASIMALAFIAPSVIVWFIRNGFRPDEPEEILNQSVQNIAAGLPVLGIPVQMAAQKGLDVATEKITGVPKTRAYYETHPNLSAPYMSMFEVTNRAIQGVPEGDWMSGINAGLQFVPAGKQISRAIDAGKIILQEKAAEKEIPGEKASTAAQKAKYFIYAEKAVNRDFYYMRSKFRSKDPREQRKADEMYKKLSKTEKKRFDLFMARLAIEAGKRKEKAGKKLEKITESMKE